MKKAVAFAIVMGIFTGCATVAVNSKKVGDETLETVSYMLPMTLLTGDVTYSLVRYKFSDDTELDYLEIRDPITVTAVSRGDRDFRYSIEAKKTSDNIFLYSNLSFSLSEHGFLTGATVDVQDHTLDAAVSALSLAAKILPAAGGIPMPMAAPASIVSETVQATFKESFELIPTLNNRTFRLPRPELGLSDERIALAQLTVGDTMPGSTGTVPPDNTAKAPDGISSTHPGIWYRRPESKNVTLTVKNPDTYPARTVTQYMPIMQLGVVNNLPLRGKAFTNRTTTITFDENGNLTTYGVESGSSADKVLVQANTAADTLIEMQQQIDAQAAAQEKADRENTFKELKSAELLAEWVACVSKNGAGHCKEEYDAYVNSLRDTN